MTDRTTHVTLGSKVNGTTTVWCNTQETKIPIIDGRITFHDTTTGASFELFVNQVKGMGSADADHLTTLSDKHKLVIKLLLHHAATQGITFTAKNIKFFVVDYYKDSGKRIDQNHYNRIISELMRRKLLLYTAGSPPTYTIATKAAETALQTGKFNNEK